MFDGSPELEDCIKDHLSYYSLPTCGIFKLDHQEDAIVAEDSWGATLRWVPTGIAINYDLAQ
jgi:hypothetical protein